MPSMTEAEMEAEMVDNIGMLLAACGPQTFEAILNSCKVQVPGYAELGEVDQHMLLHEVLDSMADSSDIHFNDVHFDEEYAVYEINDEGTGND